MNRRQSSLLLPLLALALTPLPLAVAEQMNMVELHVDRFTVAGFEARTTNAQERTGNGPISQLWARLLSQHFVSAIPNRVDSHIVAVYSNYESDKDGPYTYLLGAKVASAKDLPSGMVSRDIVPGPYAMFTAEGDAPAQMVLNLWKRIRALEKSGWLPRAYKTDYEVHYTGVADAAAKAHLDIYIGVKATQAAVPRH